MRRVLFAATVLGVLASAKPSAAANWTYRVVGGELADEHGRWTAGPSGAVVLLDESVTVRLRPESVVRPDRKFARLSLDQQGRLPTFVLELLKGAFHVENPTKGPAKKGVLVHAPNDLHGMSPGGHLVIATTGTRSAIANEDGALWVGEHGKWHSLAKGLGFSSSTAVVSPFPLAAPPSLEAARHAFSGVAGPATMGGLHWSEIPEASGYVLRLEREGDSEPLESRQIDGTVQIAPFHPVPAGAYVARVSAVDEHGLDGAVSSPVKLRVVGVELSPGAFIGQAGEIRVVPHEVVGLTHVDGLVASFGRAQGFIPAPPVVKLFRGEDTVVRLRGGEDTEGFDLRLAPRKVAVRVTAGPKAVQWPGEPVRITIDPSDGRGASLPSTVELRTRVTIGIEQVPVAFQKEGAELVAEVQPPPSSPEGPWVVRVEVKDQFGHDLGRDFVEVGVRPPPKVHPGDKGTASVARPRADRSTATARRDE